MIEYAPLQKTPFKSKVKLDARQGTIDDGMYHFIRRYSFGVLRA